MSSSPKTIIISASDDLYVTLVNDLFHSIASHHYKKPLELGLLDVGLNEKNREYFLQLGVKTVPVGVDIDYPHRATWEQQRPGLRALTASPFLPRYFPGYDIYIWLDADVWVQTPEAIDIMMAEAAKPESGIVIAPELDRCYTELFEGAKMWEKFRRWYASSYDRDIVNAMDMKPMLNVGVYALRGASPIWKAWGDIYGAALNRISGLNEESFMAHQLALNIAVYLQKLPYTVLPASYNWLTYFALPMLDKNNNTLVEPLPPHRPISQIHLTRANKNAAESIQCTDGSIVERKLTFSSTKNPVGRGMM